MENVTVRQRVRHTERGWGVVQHAGQTISRVRFESNGKTLACWNVDLHGAEVGG